MSRAVPRKPKRVAPKAVNHEQGLRISTELTSWWYESVNARRESLSEGGAAMQIKPIDVIEVLNKAGVKFVLMGAHAMAGWLRGEARSTMDVDVLVRKQHHKKAVQAVREAFPHLVVDDNPVVTRFKDPAIDAVVIDLMKPKHDIHAAVFENTVAVEKTHMIPSLEMALASKFAAMVSPNRLMKKKYLDAADFSTIADANRERIDRDKARTLGELVYEGGGNDLVSLIEDALAGRVLKLRRFRGSRRSSLPADDLRPRRRPFDIH